MSEEGRKRQGRQERHKHGNGSEADEAGGFRSCGDGSRRIGRAVARQDTKNSPPKKENKIYRERRRNDNQTSNERAGVGRKKREEKKKAKGIGG